MQLFFNQLSQIDYKPEDLSSSLNDLLQAIDEFIEKHPLACNQCQTGCCRKPWAVEVDNVSVNRQSNAIGCSKSAYIDQYLVLDENRYFDFDQFVMKKQTPHCPWVSPDNRCIIYSSRPLICRVSVT